MNAALYLVGALLLFAGANLGTFLALDFSASKAQINPPDRALHVAGSDLDIGEVWLQDGFEWHVPIRNTTDRRIVLKQIRASCTCTSVSPDSGSVEGDGTLDVILKLNLAPKNAQQAAAETPRLFAADLIVKATGETDPYLWRIHGVVKSPLSFNPISLDFGEIVAGSDASETRTLKVEAKHDLTGLEARCHSDDFSVRVEQVASRRWNVHVTPSRAIAPGRFDTFVFLAAPMGKDENLPEIPVQMNGMVLNEVHLTPSSVFFGGRSSASVDVRLSTRAGRRISKVEMHPNLPEGVRIVRGEDAQAGTADFRVECYKRGARTALGDVRFAISVERDDDPVLESLPIVVQGQR
ncbi:MAG TPA: hypothetical protein VFI31_09315 [Pirellulales bacterium]|nr:hypothetical protein [Pirellulales bacterium]